MIEVKIISHETVLLTEQVQVKEPEQNHEDGQVKTENNPQEHPLPEIYWG